KFVSQNTTQLAAVGLTQFALVSAARTPLNQLAQQSSNPVAAGLFTTGHVMGVAFDFRIAGTPVDVKTYIENQATPEQFEKVQQQGLPANAKPARLALFSQ